MLTPEQLIIRGGGIGSSEAAAVLGVDPYRSAHNIWESKLGLAESKPETYHTERGNYLEPGMRAWASTRMGVNFEACTTMVHPEHPLIIATPDGLWREGGKIMEVLELKAPGPRTWHEWGDGDDEVPLRYAIQVAQEMAVTGARRGRVGALIDGDLKIYTIHRDQYLESELVGRLEDWWTRYVETKTPPPVDGSKASKEWLGRRYPGGNKDLIQPDDELVGLLGQLAQSQAAFDDVDRALEMTKQRVKERLGNAYGVAAPGIGKATWGTTRGRTSSDWEAYARHLGGTDEGAGQFTKTGASYRTFRFHPAKGGE
jgi:putative phage-type endonuclease